MQTRALIGTILMLIALIAIGASVVMPWYTIKMEMTSPSDMQSSMTQDFYLDHAVMTSEASGFTGMEESGEEEISYDNETVKDTNVVSTFQTTQLLVYVGIMGCLLGLIGAVMVGTGKMKRGAGAAMVLMALILVLLAPIYLMSTLPGAFEEDNSEPGTITPTEGIFEDFCGSDEQSILGITMTLTWGGGTGWSLAIFAMILSIIALIFVAISKPAQEPIFAAQPVSQPGIAQPEGMFTSEPQFTVDQPGMVPSAPVGPPIGPPMAPPVMPAGLPPGEQFQCPDCMKIFILAPTKKPAILRCPYCGLEGLVE